MADFTTPKATDEICLWWSYEEQVDRGSTIAISLVDLWRFHHRSQTLTSMTLAGWKMKMKKWKIFIAKVYTDKGINHARSWHNINDNIRRQAQWYNNFDKGGMKWRLMCPKFIWVANLYLWWTGNRMQSARGVNTILKTKKYNWKNT